LLEESLAFLAGSEFVQLFLDQPNYGMTFRIRASTFIAIGSAWKLTNRVALVAEWAASS
jgi:hypothetical protein